LLAVRRSDLGVYLNSKSRVPPGILPDNTNPCAVPDPATGSPYDMEIVIDPNGNWGDGSVSHPPAPAVGVS